MGKLHPRTQWRKYEFQQLAWQLGDLDVFESLSADDRVEQLRQAQKVLPSDRQRDYAGLARSVAGSTLVKGLRTAHDPPRTRGRPDAPPPPLDVDVALLASALIEALIPAIEAAVVRAVSDALTSHMLVTGELPRTQAGH